MLRGTNVLALIKELNHQQYLPEEKLEAIRKEKTIRLFNIAKNNTEYYKDFKNFEEVPVLTKEIIRNNFEGLIAKNYKGKLHVKQSGGSTGIPLKYYTTVQSQSYLWAGIIMSWQNVGYKFGDRVAFIAGTSLIKTGWMHQLFYKLFNIDIYPATPLNQQTLQAHAAKMKQQQTKIIYGYANVINELAELIKQQPKGYLQQLKGIVCTAEILKDNVRKNITEAFNVKVGNQYGCNEGGTSAFECAAGKMHLISSKIVYEKHPDGFIISTDLANEGFIMLKYDTGDILEFANSPCSCGRTFPVIDRVIGRYSDIVVDKFNNRLHDSFFYFLFKYETSVKQYQAVYNCDAITVTIKTDGSKKPEDYQNYLNSLKEQVTFERYHLLINEPFILLQNGKHKQIVDNRAVTIQNETDGNNL